MNDSRPSWLSEWMRAKGIVLWNVADLKGIPTPRDAFGQGFPRAIAWAVPMAADIMVNIQDGPNQPYADEYACINRRINRDTHALTMEIRRRGYRARPLAASERTDTVNIRGEFAHKTAATRAGLGWIGRHCQLVTREFGSWVRLGTVFMDMGMACAVPKKRSHCGCCTRCVDACPARALSGRRWQPGMRRDEILDASTCDHWKKENFFQYHNGHNCGICSAVCPFGLKVLKRKDNAGKCSIEG